MDQNTFREFVKAISNTIQNDEADELFELIDLDDSG